MWSCVDGFEYFVEEVELNDFAHTLDSSFSKDELFTETYVLRLKTEVEANDGFVTSTQTLIFLFLRLHY